MHCIIILFSDAGRGWPWSEWCRLGWLRWKRRVVIGGYC